MHIVDAYKRLDRHRNKSYRKNEEIRYIILHHTFHPALGEFRDFQALAKYHVETKDYPGIGYHYGVSPEGIVYRLLRHDLVRAYHIDAASQNIHSDWDNHILNKRALPRPSNHNSIGIILPGDFSTGEVPQKQWNAAIDLCDNILSDHKAYIIGHRDVPGSARQDPAMDCPGIFFNMTGFVSIVRNKAIEDIVTPPHIRRYHAMLEKIKESGDEAMIHDLISLRKHIMYA